jgi:hypothetical protein
MPVGAFSGGLRIGHDTCLPRKPDTGTAKKNPTERDNPGGVQLAVERATLGGYQHGDEDGNRRAVN